MQLFGEADVKGGLAKGGPGGGVMYAWLETRDQGRFGEPKPGGTKTKPACIKVLAGSPVNRKRLRRKF